jgi:hypothetical protein
MAQRIGKFASLGTNGTASKQMAVGLHAICCSFKIAGKRHLRGCIQAVVSASSLEFVAESISLCTSTLLCDISIHFVLYTYNMPMQSW